ncbi:hypothetical protein F4859DRAFT_257552 [Xylaria cf. heliscus]|nr:hypothetical protein F4859DRAFT_257552 [Xylaria cf. heliscus]
MLHKACIYSKSRWYRHFYRRRLRRRTLSVISLHIAATHIINNSRTTHGGSLDMEATPQLRSYVGRSPHTHIEYLDRCKNNHGESLWGEFIIPSQMLKDDPAPQQSELLKAPVEVLFNIMSLCTPVDTVCLALTCKALLQSKELFQRRYNNIHPIPSMKKHSQLGYKCMGIFTLLIRTRPVDARGRPAIHFMPCYACFNNNNRSNAGEYWRERPSPSPSDSTEIVQRLSIRCPWCNARAEV